MKIIPSGKGWFLWIMERVYGGDPKRISAAARAQHLSWVSIKVNDGAKDYNNNPFIFMGRTVPVMAPDDIIQPLVDALHAEGILVFGWGYIYLFNPLAEAEKSIQRVNKFRLDGYMVNGEKEWYFKVGPAREYMDALRAGLPDTSIGLCSYRFPSYHPEFPWYTALQDADYHVPQVYWLGSHNPSAQLAQSVDELRAKKDIPIIPLGYAYQNEVDGTRPTQKEIIGFHNKSITLGLPGNGWYEWGDAIVNANVERYVAPLEWGVLDSPPVPEGDAMFEGIVLVDKLNIRATPSSVGLDVGDLFKGNEIAGDVITNANGYDWLRLTAPLAYAGNFVALGTTLAPRSYVQITQVDDPDPTPLTLEERVTRVEADIVEIKKKLGMV